MTLRYGRMMRTTVALAVLGAALALSPSAALAAGQTQTAPSKKSKEAATLFDRLGGLGAIKSVVNDFVDRVGLDPRINRYFSSTDLPAMKGHLADQICEATGGPCKYTGRAMKPLHEGMGITGGDFNAMMENLLAALESHKVSKEDAGALMGLLLAMRGDIVEKP